MEAASCHSEIEELGFTLLPGVYTAEECAAIASALEQALHATADDAVALRRQNGVLYGARNLLDVFPQVQSLWRRPRLLELLEIELGERCGLVRGLYFDKPPAGNWSLPWHQDLTIAVRDNTLPSDQFRNRTTKAGVPHVEAPRELLERMLTLRIHLDDVDAENGPLEVLPGSHRLIGTAEVTPHASRAIHTSAGGVLAIRPLVSHASGPSAPGTIRHRRVIHLEFAASPVLPDGYQWRHFFSATADCEPGDRRSN
jgi:hypothetical protein